MGGKLGAVRKPPASARIEMEREDLGGTRKQNNRMGGRGGGGQHKSQVFRPLQFPMSC